jgi:preprotein translocase subunit SecY
VFRTFRNIANVPELRKRLLITLGLLLVYRIGSYITLPGVNTQVLEEVTKQTGGGIFDYIGMLTGGRLQDCTLFGLGIMPYISASIMFQLLIKVIPSLEALSKEGPAGFRKIRQYERYATVAICLVQASFITVWMMGRQVSGSGGETLHLISSATFWWRIQTVIALTAGTVFLMWLGEQITEFGISNGISLIIMTGIIGRMPGAVAYFGGEISTAIANNENIAPQVAKIAVFVFLFIGVVAAVVMITQGQRRIPVQQQKQARGRRIYGGQKYYLPLRVNQGGVMPVIFAQSLLMLPVAFLGSISGLGIIRDIFQIGKFWYIFVYCAMIMFFEYFWTALTFNPTEMATQLKERGNFIPGVRPGKRTAEFLEKITNRVALAGGTFLCFIAIFPQIVSSSIGIPYMISAFLGGTGILIVVGVALELVQRIESHLLMRHYDGFMRKPQRGRGR